MLFESADGFLEFFVKGLAHEHDVGDAGAHIDGEKMFVQDTGDDAMKEPGFYGNAPHGGYPTRLAVGEGFFGQCAVDKRRILVTTMPADAVPIGAPLFEALPRSMVVFPTPGRPRRRTLSPVLMMSSIVVMVP